MPYIKTAFNWGFAHSTVADCSRLSITGSTGVMVVVVEENDATLLQCRVYYSAVCITVPCALSVKHAVI